MEQTHRRGNEIGPFGQHIVDVGLGRLIHDDPQGTVFVVVKQVHDTAQEGPAVDRWRRYQQSPPVRDGSVERTHRPMMHPSRSDRSDRQPCAAPIIWLMSKASEEFTVDELASRAGMTVRNVRAYASRGLIDAPRLEGRTGFYSTQHLQRLQLVRQLLDRGYTLSAVEKALRSTPVSAAGPTLDLISMLDLPSEDGADEIMSREDLAALAGVGLDSSLIDALAENGLVSWIEGDHQHVHLVEPTIVRSGASVVAMGVSPETVIGLFPVLDHHMRNVAQTLVTSIASEIIEPFVAEGMPEEHWPELLSKVEHLLPIASQIVLAVFRRQLQQAIDEQIAAELKAVEEKSERSRKKRR